MLLPKHTHLNNEAPEHNRRYVIFALDDELFGNGQKFRERCNGKFKPLRGSYVMENTGEQVIEPSYIMELEDYEVLSVEDFTKGQESVLRLSMPSVMNNYKRYATLVYKDGREEYIGLLTHVTEEEALKSPYWTQDLTTGSYFITKEE